MGTRNVGWTYHHVAIIKRSYGLCSYLLRDKKCLRSVFQKQEKWLKYGIFL